jgi:hypothetical protein
MKKETVVLWIKEQRTEVFFSETCTMAKDTKLLTVLSNCEHKTYAIADIFPRIPREDFANPQDRVIC